MANTNLSAGQRVQVRFHDGRVFPGVIKGANEVMATFEPDGGLTLVLRRDLAQQTPVWAFQGLPVQVAAVLPMGRAEFHRRLFDLERRTRYIVEGK